jgi:hypothetical protein
MRRSTVVLILLATAQVPRTAPAQSPNAAPAPAACTYETCALRIEPSFFAPPKLLRGHSGEEVGRLGAFGGGIDTLLTGPDSAAVYGRRYAGDTRRASVLGLIGAAAYVVALARSNGFRDRDGTTTAIALTGAGFAIASIPFTLRATRSLSRAVWFYNAALAGR